MSNYIADFKNGAVNPYTFVSLGSGVERSGHVKLGNLSGVIHCSMKNAAPLALPDLPNAVEEIIIGEKGETETHKKAPFFKVNGKPVITGSEIRGVIRSAYETLSNSCLSVNNNNILSARSADVRSPGLIRFENEDKKWHLYKANAERLKYDGSEDFDEKADTFKRTWKNYEYKKGKPISKNKIPVSYKFSTSFEEIKADDLDLAVDDYNTVSDIYLENAEKENPNTDLRNYIIKPLKDGKCCPVYYREFSDDGKNYVWLSPAQISRSVFRNKVDDLLGTYHHCEDTDNVCEACGLFGMIGKKGSTSAIASRLRFTDAKLENEAKLTYKTLKELSSPRLSSIEFYSTAPKMEFQWNYDTKGVKLNGRKYYFHHNCDCTTTEKTGRNLTTELLEKGAEFSFDIFFDKLTENELNRLVWTLAIGENTTDSHRMHKLGHGKPLGLGSVKITVDSVTKRSFDFDKMTFTDEKMNVSAFFENVPFDTSAEYFKEYMAVTDFDYLEGRPVAYPYGDDGSNKKTAKGAIAWFKGNRNDSAVVNKENICKIRYHLPKITDKDQLVLPALIKNNSSNRNNNSNHKTEHSNKNNSHYQKNYEPKQIMPLTTDIVCPNCRHKMKRTKNRYAIKTKEICESCGRPFTVTY